MDSITVIISKYHPKWTFSAESLAVATTEVVVMLSVQFAELLSVLSVASTLEDLGWSFFSVVALGMDLILDLLLALKLRNKASTWIVECNSIIINSFNNKIKHIFEPE